MAKQIIDIGAQGNDGTGDSIRESFKKVNENFTEIYAVLGVSGSIPFSSLADTPDTYGHNQILATSNDGTKITARNVVAGEGITIDTSNDSELVFSTETSSTVLQGPLNAENYPIGNLPDPTQSAVDSFNAVHGPLGSTTNINKLPVTKGWADNTYLPKVGPAGFSNTLTVENLSVTGTTDFNGNQLNNIADPLDDSDAATKRYVDNASAASTVNLFVSTNGTDDQSAVPYSNRGRSYAQAFRSIQAATQFASEILSRASYIPNAYKQVIAYSTTPTNTSSTITSVGFIDGYHNIQGYEDAKFLIEQNKNFIVAEVVAYVADQFGSDFALNESILETTIQSFVDATVYDLIVGGNLLSYKAGKKYDFDIRTLSGVYSNRITNGQTAVTFFKELVLQVINQYQTPAYQTSVTQFLDPSRTPSVPAINDLTSNLNIIAGSFNINPVKGDGYYKITFTNGGNPSVVQGSPSNCDIVPGKTIQGTVSLALGEIVSYTQGNYPTVGPTDDTITLHLTEPKLFSVGETLEYSYGTLDTSVTIHVETGVYEEDYPIRVPENVSIIGDDKSRVIVKPADRESNSPYANIFFYRNKTIDSLTVTSVNYGYHYLVDPEDSNSDAKHNNSIDAFLLNDSSIIKHLTIQNFGGFAMVLDPQGSVFNNPPEASDIAVISQSVNAYVPRIGQYIDGFAGRLLTTLTSSANSGKTLTLTHVDNSLMTREPVSPTVFYVSGVQYKISSFKNYDPVAGTIIAVLDSSTPYLGNTGSSIIIEQAGFRSMAADDVDFNNDQGYGILAINDSLSYAKNVRTNYCHTSFWAANGAKVFTSAGTSSNGRYGLRSTGYSSVETPVAVTLGESLTQNIVAYEDATYTNTEGSSYIYVTGYTTVRKQSEIEINHAGVIQRYYISNLETGGTLPNGVTKLTISLYPNSVSGEDKLLANVSNNTPVVLRNLAIFKVNTPKAISVDNTLIFTENPTVAYRVLASVNSSGSSVVTIRETYDYIDASLYPTQPAGHGGVGDTLIAVYNLSSADRSRIVGSKIAWGTSTYTVSAYQTPAQTGFAWAVITLSTPLSEAVTGFDNQLTLRASVAVNGAGTVVKNYSLITADNHKFNDVGTGGVNTVNYPGTPSVAPVQANEIIESSSGKVVYVTTDQDGVFRVGKYFSVNQNTGTISISGTASLNNIDGLGFKRGVTVSEFSNDNSFISNSSDTVPVQSAVRGYIDSRLGQTHTGTPVASADKIGPGYLPLDGSAVMQGNLNLNGNFGVNFRAPENLTDAANKYYVDYVNWLYRRLRLLSDVELDINTPLTQPIAFGGKVSDGNGNWLVTFTFTGQQQYPVGTLYEVDNIRPLAYNGTFESVASTLTSVTLKYTTDPGLFLNSVTAAGIKVTAITSHGDMLVYNGSTGKWNNKTLVGDGRLVYSNGVLNFVIPAGTVTRQQMANIATGKVLGNFTGGSTYPQEVNASTVVTKGFDSLLSNTGVITFTAGMPNSYDTTPVTITGASSSILKTGANGALTVRRITTGSVTTTGLLTGKWYLETGSQLHSTYADLAECYSSDQEYEPGTVVVFGGEAEVTTTSVMNDTRVAGVVTTDPAYIMNAEIQGKKVAIALQGRVPCKVVGRVKKGDMLTTSSKPGIAVKALSPTLGAIIGKALQDKDDGEVGVIEVAVGRT